jgi:hypothetical protein
MNFHSPKHRVWRPRMDSDHVFNPFTRSTQSEAFLNADMLEDIEPMPVGSEAEGREAQADPLKSNPS